MTREEVDASAMGLPGATKVTLWGRLDVYKVRDRVFAIWRDGESLSFKASAIAYAVLTEDGPGRPAPGFVRGHWVAMPLDELTPADAAGWIADSHRLVAAGLTRKQRAELGL